MIPNMICFSIPIPAVFSKSDITRVISQASYLRSKRYRFLWDEVKSLWYHFIHQIASHSEMFIAHVSNAVSWFYLMFLVRLWICSRSHCLIGRSWMYRRYCYSKMIGCNVMSKWYYINRKMPPYHLWHIRDITFSWSS